MRVATTVKESQRLEGPAAPRVRKRMAAFTKFFLEVASTKWRFRRGLMPPDAFARTHYLGA